jgi:hypothetical protein
MQPLLLSASASFGSSNWKRTARRTPAGRAAPGAEAADAAVGDAPLLMLLPPLTPLVVDARASSACFLLPLLTPLGLAPLVADTRASSACFLLPSASRTFGSEAQLDCQAPGAAGSHPPASDLPSFRKHECPASL